MVELEAPRVAAPGLGTSAFTGWHRMLVGAAESGVPARVMCVRPHGILRHRCGQLVPRGARHELACSRSGAGFYLRMNGAVCGTGSPWTVKFRTCEPVARPLVSRL